MNEKFFNLKKTKQDAILNGILKVFSKKNYQYSSTDEIVKEANISKGPLFHYFINKKGAYEFAYDYSLKLIMLEFNTIENTKEDNYFELWKQIEEGHYYIMKQYPYMMAFIEQVHKEEDLNIKQDLLLKEIKLLKSYASILDKADQTKFPKNELLTKSTFYILEGINREYYKKKELDIKSLYLCKIEYLTFLKNINQNPKRL